MSTKGSLILNNDGEHWYEETLNPRYKEGKFEGFDVEIEISNEIIVDYELCKHDGFSITIKGDSHLAKILAKYLRGIDEKSVL